MWTVPPARMKARREHRVPLCGRAMQILEEARELGDGSPLVFTLGDGQPIFDKRLRRLLRKLEIAAVPHGFRSSFRDWAAAETNHPREVGEAALAHVVRNKVEAAYRRSDLFERRRRLMDGWAAYVAGESRDPEAGLTRQDEPEEGAVRVRPAHPPPRAARCGSCKTAFRGVAGASSSTARICSRAPSCPHIRSLPAGNGRRVPRRRYSRGAARRRGTEKALALWRQKDIDTYTSRVTCIYYNICLTYYGYIYIFDLRCKEYQRITMSGVKDIARRQYARLIDRAAQQLAGLQVPREGWINIMRKALGISGPELARRLGVTRAAVYQAERKEREGGVTLHHMEALAEALGGHFVYAIVPAESIEDILLTQARKKAEHVTRRASAHMALEMQALTPLQTDEEIERLARELLRERPADFWKLR